MDANQQLLKRICLQIGITASFVIAGLALLSVLGFPTQKFADLGKLLGVRLIDNQGAGGLTAQKPAAAAHEEAIKPETDISLTLPPHVYGLVGGELNLQYDSIVVSKDSGQYRFSVTCKECPIVNPYDRRSWSAKNLKAGNFGLLVGVSSLDFKKSLGLAQTKLRVSSPEKLANSEPRILVFGDSITRQHWWVNDLARFLKQNKVTGWSMIGREYEDGTPPFSEKPLEGVRHEAEYGWSFSFFSSFIAADKTQAKTFRRSKSPFVYGASPAEAKLDVKRYYDEQAEGKSADYVIMQAGINDIWGVNADDEVLLKKRIDVTVANAEKLVAAFHKADPKTQVGVVLPAPFTKDQKDFKDAYGNDVTWWSARRGQHALVKAMIAKFGNRETEGVWIIPLYASFDALDGYPIDNAGHPNRFGHQQIANSVFSWMSWVAQERKKQ